MTVRTMTAGNRDWFVASLTDDTGHVSILGTFPTERDAEDAVTREETRLATLPDASSPTVGWFHGETLSKTTGLCR